MTFIGDRCYCMIKSCYQRTRSHSLKKVMKTIDIQRFWNFLVYNKSNMRILDRSKTYKKSSRLINGYSESSRLNRFLSKVICLEHETLNIRTRKISQFCSIFPSDVPELYAQCIISILFSFLCEQNSFLFTL